MKRSKKYRGMCRSTPFCFLSKVKAVSEGLASNNLQILASRILDLLEI
jgi:hypothetical protein